MQDSRLVKAIKLLFNPVRLYEAFVVFTPRLWSDRYYLKCKYHWRHRLRPDLDNPKTFNEKMIWLMLNEWKDIYPVLVDKVKVKEWVAEKIGEKYIIPTYGVWERAEDIDFDSLPDKFVLKCNHNSQEGLCICRDKSSLNKKKTIRMLKKALNCDYSLRSGEPAYAKVPRRVLAEMLLEDSTGDLWDYKFECYSGKVGFVHVCTDRFNPDGARYDVYDSDWNWIDVREEHPNIKERVPRPMHFDEMKRIAETLSAGLRFVRVDLYQVGDKIYFGEMTLHSGGGMDRYDPRSADLLLGNLIELGIK